jgi:Flp pilus assembly protein TadG
MWWTCNYNQPNVLAGLFKRPARYFVCDRSGGVVIKFALALPALVAAAAAAVDYSTAASTRSKMQAVADSAALASVRELQLARADANRIIAVANNVVDSLIEEVSTHVMVDFKTMTVQVVIEKQYNHFFRTSTETSTTKLSVLAKAKMSGSMPLCLLGLDPRAPQTISLEQSALMTAPGCLVQSNSQSAMGIQSKTNAVLKAGMICSAGGKVQSTSANFSPTPVTDCPALSDPLSSRAPPSVGACNHNNKVVDGGYEVLRPGVYCGGLKVTRGAVAKLASGIFIIKDGPLIVDDRASLTGSEVGFFLTGSDANLTFDADSIISLSAPKAGPLAGILIFDDPSGTNARAKPPKSGRGAAGRNKITGAPRQHQILSDDARNLLGTIYMPQGEIIIDALKPIADKSAYTVLVVKQLRLYSGPNLILNTDYSASEVPVPQGVGPYGSKIFLSN